MIYYDLRVGGIAGTWNGEDLNYEQSEYLSKCMKEYQHVHRDTAPIVHPYPNVIFKTRTINIDMIASFLSVSRRSSLICSSQVSFKLDTMNLAPHVKHTIKHIVKGDVKDDWFIYYFYKDNMKTVEYDKSVFQIIERYSWEDDSMSRQERPKVIRGNLTFNDYNEYSNARRQLDHNNEELWPNLIKLKTISAKYDLQTGLVWNRDFIISAQLEEYLRSLNGVDFSIFKPRFTIET